MIPFNKPFITGDEFSNIKKAAELGKLSGGGHFTDLCQSYFQERYETGKCLLTTSCTDALEMVAILLDIKPGDEVILPSFTFVSTANAFVLRGATPIFVDSRDDHPGINEVCIESKITSRTKAIIIVHYAGVSCDMSEMLRVSDKYNIPLIEDAAQAIDSYYLDKSGGKKALGTFGTFATFSFHETKNIISGEGGMLVINDNAYLERAQIIWEKGTNRHAFFRGVVDKYSWVDIGSSFLPSEMIAAFLYAQFLKIESIQQRRVEYWNRYHAGLVEYSDLIKLPFIPAYSTNNAHMFYLVCKPAINRGELITWLRVNGIQAVFHYQNLQRSDFYEKLNPENSEVHSNSDYYSDHLLRLPLYYDLGFENIDKICQLITQFIR